MNQKCGGVPSTTARGADLGLEKSDDLGDVEDPLLVESKHLRGTRRGGDGEGRRGAGGYQPRVRGGVGYEGRTRLEVEAQVLLEDVQLAEVRVSLLDRV